MKLYAKCLKANSRSLRQNMTDAECALWSRLRRKQLYGKPFYRQKPLLNYIVDFYCPAAKLVIELDGGQHFDMKNSEKDRIRDKNLSELGLKVLRFDNLQVLKEMEAVLAVIAEKVRESR